MDSPQDPQQRAACVQDRRPVPKGRWFELRISSVRGNTNTFNIEAYRVKSWGTAQRWTLGNLHVAIRIESFRETACRGGIDVFLLPLSLWSPTLRPSRIRIKLLQWRVRWNLLSEEEESPLHSGHRRPVREINKNSTNSLITVDLPMGCVYVQKV